MVEVANEELKVDEEPTVDEEAKIEVMVKEEEAPIEVIASLWVGGIATLTLILLIILQVSVFQ